MTVTTVGPETAISMSTQQKFAPSLLSSIIGTDPTLAHERFTTYVFFSTLLVPNAARRFKSALRHERFVMADERQYERLLRTIRIRNRDSQKRNHRLKKQIDRLHGALFDSYYSSEATVNSISPSPLFNQTPHWTGEPRPRARHVKLTSRWPDARYLKMLVSDLGYDGSAACAAIISGHTPWVRPLSDRRRAVAHDSESHESESARETPYRGFVGGLPYMPASPQLRTVVGGGHKAEAVVRVIAQHRWSDQISAAVFDVVYMRKRPSEVARGAKVETIYTYAKLVRRELEAKAA